MKGDRDAADLAWRMFKQTGEINYYLLYNKLKGRD